MHSKRFYSDDLEAAGGRRADGGDARSTLQVWMDERQAPEVRLLKFDAWLRQLLVDKITWPADPGRRRKMVEQCRVLVERMVIELRTRGWLFDGKLLAAHVTAAVEEVAKAQAEGRVKDLWPFFRALLQRYVGTRADELREEALSARCHISNLVGSISTRLPSLVAQRTDETLREKLARQRHKDAARQADADQPRLL